MSFQARLQVDEPIETWSSLELAALERFWDGLELAISNEPHRTGAVYLLGYVAEVMLKVAFYRINGLTAADEARRDLLTRRAHWRRRNLHDVAALADLLIEERQLQGRAFDPAFAGQVRACALAVGSHWTETLRYRHTTAEESELSEVFQNVDWLLAHATLLWS